MSIFRRLLRRPKSSKAGNPGQGINDCMGRLTEVDKAVRRGIFAVPVRERRAVLNMYRTALRVQSRGIVQFIHKLEEEGEI